MWTLMASVRIYFVVGAILVAIVWRIVEKRRLSKKGGDEKREDHQKEVI